MRDSRSPRGVEEHLFKIEADGPGKGIEVRVLYKPRPNRVVEDVESMASPIVRSADDMVVIVLLELELGPIPPDP
jgi:hypothetical protein